MPKRTLYMLVAVPACKARKSRKPRKLPARDKETGRFRPKKAQKQKRDAAGRFK